MTASAQGRQASTAEPSSMSFSYFAAAYGGPHLPTAWMADPAAQPRVHLPPEERRGIAEASPDGTLLAHYVAADAVDGARFEFTSTESGEVVDELNVDPATIGYTLWSPDSRAPRARRRMSRHSSGTRTSRQAITLLGTTTIDPAVQVDVQTAGTLRVNGRTELSGRVMAGRLAATGAATINAASPTEMG